MVDIKKLALPFVMIGPLIGGALVAGGAWATNNATAAELVKRVGQQEARVSKLEEQRAEEAVQRTELKTDMKYVVKALERLEDRLGTKK